MSHLFLVNPRTSSYQPISLSSAFFIFSFGPEHTFYAAATSSYGISNLRLLAQFTHKFELRYMEKLMGGTIEEIPDVYDKERSPLFHADKIETPLLVRIIEIVVSSLIPF